MSFYWVNLGRTYQEVADHKFLWAPSHTFNSRGKKLIDGGWRHVPEVKRGDIIFCNENSRIIYVAVAKKNSYPAERPANRNFDQWKRDGFKIEVDLVILGTPVKLDDFRNELYERFNDATSPKLLTVQRMPAQKYLTRLPDGAGILIMNTLGDIALPIHDRITKTNTHKLTETEREAVIKARVGQGQFRRDVLDLWGSTCPVTGINMPELLVASHIVSWQLSDNYEKLDKFNGLPMSPAADKLFDKGLISFDDSGHLLVSARLTSGTLLKLGLKSDLRIRGLRPEHRKYLSRHREIYGFDQQKGRS